MSNFRKRIEEDEYFYDTAVVSHGFTDYLRDYDFVIDRPAPLPPELRSGYKIGYIKGRDRYRFTHCPEVHVTTSVGDEIWARSWDEVFTDHAAWKAAGEPDGFVWGVKWADAYPGLSYAADSALALDWTKRLGREMHEVVVETNTFTARLVCHDLVVHQIAVGDPLTDELTPCDPTLRSGESDESIAR